MTTTNTKSSICTCAHYDDDSTYKINVEDSDVSLSSAESHLVSNLRSRVMSRTPICGPGLALLENPDSEEVVESLKDGKRVINFYGSTTDREIEIWLDGDFSDLKSDDTDLTCELLGTIPQSEAEAYWEACNQAESDRVNGQLQGI